MAPRKTKMRHRRQKRRKRHRRRRKTEGGSRRGGPVTLVQHVWIDLMRIDDGAATSSPEGIPAGGRCDRRVKIRPEEAAGGEAWAEDE